MSDNSKKGKKKSFTDMVIEQKGKDQQDGSEHSEDFNKNLDVLKERAAQLEDHLRRTVADNENIKRTMQRQISDASDYAVTQFARDMIDSCDNLKRVMKNLRDDDPVHEGIRVAHQKIISDLKKYGIEELDPIGETFDSNLHQAVMERENNEKEVGTIVEVLQTGFTIKSRLLRPAMVVISKSTNN